MVRVEHRAEAGEGRSSRGPPTCSTGLCDEGATGSALCTCCARAAMPAVTTSDPLGISARGHEMYRYTSFLSLERSWKASTRLSTFAATAADNVYQIAWSLNMGRSSLPRPSWSLDHHPLATPWCKLRVGSANLRKLRSAEARELADAAPVRCGMVQSSAEWLLRAVLPGWIHSTRGASQDSISTL
jgi:hypothetical protein